MSVMAHRHKGSRSERVISGQDLPEVVPWQDAPHRKPSERQSHAYPQVVVVDSTPLGEKLESRFSRFSLASQRAPLPPSPTISRKSSFVPKKKKHWILIVIVIIVIALAIGIAAAVAVTLSQKSHKTSGTAHGSSNDGAAAAPDATSAAPNTVVVTAAAAAPTATSNPTPTSASADAATSAPVCASYAGVGIGDLPQSYAGQVTSQPPNTVHINVQFGNKMPWDRVSANQTQMSSMQSLVPQAFSFALQIDTSQIQMGALIPNDTAAELCYIQTVAQVYAPSQYANVLESYAFNWSSPLFHSPVKDVYTLMSDMYNMTFPAD